MASIPLWTGTTGSLIEPAKTPVESLSVSGYLKGLDASEKDPGTAASIAKGITSGIEAYQSTRHNAQVIDQTDLKLESDQMKLEAQRANQGLQQEVDTGKLEKEKADLAEATRQRQSEDELYAIMKGDDGQAKADAVTSGTYAETLSKNPELKKYAVESASQYMSPVQRRAFIKDATTKRSQQLAEKNRAEFEKQYTKYSSEFAVSPLVAAARRADPSANTVDIANELEFVPTGKFSYEDDGTPKRKDGRVIENPLEPGAAKTYDVIRGGRRIATDALPKERDDLLKLRSLSYQISGDLEDEPETRTLRRDQKRAARSAAPNGAAAPVAQPPQAQDSLDNFMQGPQQGPPRPPANAKPVPLSDYSKTISKIPLAGPDGKLNFRKDSGIPALFAQSTGVSPQVARKYQDEISLLLDMAHGPIGVKSFWGDSPSMTQFQQVKNNFITNVLADDFKVKTKSAPLPGFDEAGITAHNARVATAHAAINNPSLSQPAVVSAQDLVTVGSAEELYVNRNYERVTQRVDSLLALTREALQTQSAARIQKGATTAGLLNTLKSYK